MTGRIVQPPVAVKKCKKLKNYYENKITTLSYRFNNFKWNLKKYTTKVKSSHYWDSVFKILVLVI